MCVRVCALTELRSQSLGILSGNLPVFLQVQLISYQHYLSVVPGVCLDLGRPGKHNNTTFSQLLHCMSCTTVIS